VKIRWSPRALQDYFLILEYLQQKWGSKVVKSFASRVNQVLDMISENPSLFLASNTKKKIRRCVLRKQVSLYYRVREQEIEIVAFFDNRKNPVNRNF
jgi:plasmid stabilization system protein ParE